jgi:hypothetical protein
MVPDPVPSPVLESEPTRLVAAILTFFGAVNGLLTLLKVYSPVVGGSLMLVVSAAVALGGELVRSKVWSRKSVTNLVDGIAAGAPAVMPPK